MGQNLHGSATTSDNTSRRDNIRKRRKRRYGPNSDNGVVTSVRRLKAWNVIVSAAV